MSETPLQYLASKRDKALQQLDSTCNPVERSNWIAVVEAYNEGIWAVKKVMQDLGGDRHE